MKRISPLLILAAVLGIGAFLVTGDAWAAVADTPHNLNNSGYTVRQSQVCLPCHTPHGARRMEPGADHAEVLWNHAITEATFTMYPTSNPQDPQPNGASKRCLSCHDGVTAVDNYGGSNGTSVMTGDEALGADLSDDHPISVTYVTSRSYRSPTDAGFTGVKLINDKVECSSCHYAHSNDRGDFLRTSNEGSALCLKCHIK